MEIVLFKEKETPNTVRYAEDPDQPPVFGKVYVQKWALRKLNGGDIPEKIKVTVEPEY